MKLLYINLFLLTLTAIVYADVWKFNVVSILGTAYDVGLKYENKVTKMTSEVYPLYTVTIRSGSTTEYHYVAMDKSGNVVAEEKIKRVYNSNTPNINEVYNRTTKTVNVPSLPRAFNPIYPGGSAKYQDFPRNQIYNLYASCNDDQYDDLKYSPFGEGKTKNENFANCTINLITPNETYQRTGALYLVGYNSRLYKKLSWKFKLDKKIFGRKTIKVRALASDPTLMRDKLASELFRSAGVPTYSGTYIRVMINDDVWGLYNIVDTVGGNWLASVIHGNDDAHVGYNYKIYSSVPNGPFASLRYLGEDPDSYEYSGSYEADEVDKNDTQAPNEFYRLARFTKMFEDWTKTYKNDQSQNAVTALEKFFDLESFLRQLVIESLTFAYDNFWAQLGNSAIYYNPEKNKYQIIPYDFDGTFFGSCDSPYYASDYITDCISWADNTAVDKYFVNNIMRHELIVTRYQQIMNQIIKTVFNVDGVSAFIDAVSNLIREDVSWNFSLIDTLDNSGYENHFTLKNFEDNTNFKMVEYNGSINYNDANYGLKQWVQLRGGYCKNYVESELGSVPAAPVNPVNPVNPEPTPEVAPVQPTTTVAAPPPVVTTKPTTTTTVIVAPKPTTVTSKVTISKKVIPIKSTTTTHRIRNTRKVTIKKVVSRTKYAARPPELNRTF